MAVSRRSKIILLVVLLLIISCGVAYKYLSPTPSKNVLWLVESINQLHQLWVNKIPPDMDAATYYHKAYQILNETKFLDIVDDLQKKIPDTWAITPWKAEQYPQLAAYISQHPQVMDFIRQGSEQPFCRNAVAGWFDGTGGLGEPIELSDRNVPEFLIANLGLNIGEKGLKESIPDLAVTLQFFRHLEQKDNLTSAVSVMAAEKQYLLPLLENALLSYEADAVSYRTLIKELSQLDKLAKKAVSDNTYKEQIHLKFMIYEAYNASDFSSLSGRLLSKHILAAIIWELNKLIYPFDKTLKDYESYLEIQRKLQTMDAYSDEARQLHKKSGDLLKKLMRKSKILAISVPRFPNISYEEARINAERRLVIILAALKLYKLDRGDYPESLDKLIPEYLEVPPVDAFSGKPWVYERVADKITVASSNKEEEVQIVIPISPHDSTPEQPADLIEGNF